MNLCAVLHSNLGYNSTASAGRSEDVEEFSCALVRASKWRIESFCFASCNHTTRVLQKTDRSRTCNYLSKSWEEYVWPHVFLPNMYLHKNHFQTLSPQMTTGAEGVDWRSSGKGEKETQVLEQLAEFRWLALSDQLWTASAVATFRALDVEHCLGTTWHLFFWYVQWLLTAFLCLTRSLPKKLEVRQEVSHPCCWDKICVYSKIRSVKKGEPPLIQLSACTGRSCIWKKALLSTCQCFAFPLDALLLEKWVKPQNCV